MPLACELRNYSKHQATMADSDSSFITLVIQNEHIRQILPIYKHEDTCKNSRSFSATQSTRKQPYAISN